MNNLNNDVDPNSFCRFITKKCYFSEPRAGDNPIDQEIKRRIMAAIEDAKANIALQKILESREDMMSERDSEPVLKLNRHDSPTLESQMDVARRTLSSSSSITYPNDRPLTSSSTITRSPIIPPSYEDKLKHPM